MTPNAETQKAPQSDALWDLIAECRRIVCCGPDQRLVDRLRELMRLEAEHGKTQ